MMTKYKLVVEFETDEEVDVEGLLRGSAFYENDFLGAVTHTELNEIDG